MSKMHKTFYYARVSTREQNLDRQLEAFRALGADEREIITDKESGKNLDRPGYQALKSTMLRSGDTLVVKSLDRLSRGRTSIVIAHRLSTIRNADTIAVIEHGRIAERGSHRELLEKNGIYTALYEAQKGTEDER